jgi:hypothetical protein
MTIQHLERAAVSSSQRILRTDHNDPEIPQLLRTELFLLAHDEETGRPHLDQRSLTLGLAVAILLELWLAGRIHIGWRFDVRRGGWVTDPGLIVVARRDPVGDPLSDLALTEIWNTGTPLRVRDFVRRFAGLVELHERVRAHMVSAGVIRRTWQRRFWFFKTERYVPVDPAEPVRLRTRIRKLANRDQRDTIGHATVAETRLVALAAVVTALGMTRHLKPPEMSPAQLQQRLERLIRTFEDPTVQEAAAAINRRYAPAS